MSYKKNIIFKRESKKYAKCANITYLRTKSADFSKTSGLGETKGIFFWEVIDQGLLIAGFMAIAFLYEFLWRRAEFVSQD